MSRKYKGISVTEIEGGLEAIKPSSTGYGVAFKLFNKQSIQDALDLLESNPDFCYTIFAITVYHKKHSRYKWVCIDYGLPTTTTIAVDNKIVWPKMGVNQ